MFQNISELQRNSILNEKLKSDILQTNDCIE